MNFHSGFKVVPFLPRSPGMLVQLAHQYPRGVSEPAIYDKTIVHQDSTPSMRRTGNSAPDLSVCLVTV